jgi:hypothetical protein
VSARAGGGYESNQLDSVPDEYGGFASSDFNGWKLETNRFHRVYRRREASYTCMLGLPETSTHGKR